jgi:hypothetical protein
VLGQRLDVRGLAGAVDAFERDESTAHALLSGFLSASCRAGIY